MSNHSPNHHHFGNGESIRSHPVAIAAGGLNVPLDMRPRVIDPVQPSVALRRAAIATGLDDQLVDFARGQVARVDALVGFPQIARPALLASDVLCACRLSPRSLLRRHLKPAMLPSVFALLPSAHALAALVGKAKQTALVASKYLRVCGQFAIALVADAMTRKRSYSARSWHPEYYRRSLYVSIENGC